MLKCKSIITIVRNSRLFVNGKRAQNGMNARTSRIHAILGPLCAYAVCRRVPHSGQKRALASTETEQLGQKRSGSGNLVPQSWQNFPGGPMRRQVGHMIASG